MKSVTCVNVSVHGDQLTRGNRYSVLAVAKTTGNMRVQIDKGNVRWYPALCFSNCRFEPMLAGFQIDDPIFPNEDRLIEVTVKLTNGERRWCVFATPPALIGRGDGWIEGTATRFFYNFPHLIITDSVSLERIGVILKYIDSQGELVQCTRPLQDADVDWRTADQAEEIS